MLLRAFALQMMPGKSLNGAPRTCVNHLEHLQMPLRMRSGTPSTHPCGFRRTRTSEDQALPVVAVVVAAVVAVVVASVVAMRPSKQTPPTNVTFKTNATGPRQFQDESYRPMPSHLQDKRHRPMPLSRQTPPAHATFRPDSAGTSYRATQQRWTWPKQSNRGERG